MIFKTQALLVARSIFCLLAIIVAGSESLFSQAAERPGSADLLPKSTVAYVQVHNVRDLVEKLYESNFGRLLADDSIAPMVSDLYSTAEDAYSGVEDRVGLSIEEIMELPAGEICFAAIAPRRKDTVFVLIIDTDEESEVVDRALDRGRKFAGEKEVEIETEESDEITLEKFRVRGRQWVVFRNGGTIVAGSDEDEVKNIIERWNEREVDKAPPLSENRKFITIMNRCRGSKEAPNDFRFFVDPIALAKSLTRGNLGAQFAINSLPLLGLDGLLGIGGSMIIDEMNFDFVAQLFVRLANPRSGVFEMLALKPGEYEPQNWVPDTALTYLSSSWDVDKLFSELEQMNDSFNFEGAFNEFIEDEINDEFDIDIKEDFLEHLSGRATIVHMTGGAENSLKEQALAFGFGLTDEDAILELNDKIVKKFRDRNGEDSIEEKEYKGVTYWQEADAAVEKQRQQLEKAGVPPGFRQVPQPAYTITEGHLIYSFNPAFIERAIDTARGKKASLYDSDEFQNASREMTKLLGTDLPHAVIYHQPAELLRMAFKLAENEDAADFLKDFENKHADGVLKAMEDNPLPDWSEVKGYLPASGGFVTSDENGYHFSFFQLKTEK